MKPFRLITAFTAFVCACTVAAPVLAGEAAPRLRDGRWTVVFRSATLPADAGARVAAAGGVVGRTLDDVGVLIASGNAAFAKRLRADAAVLAVGLEKFYTLPQVVRGGSEVESFGEPTSDDRRYWLQWNVRRIGAPAMWARVPLEVQNLATVAVLDTGVMDTHRDLSGQIVDMVATNYCQEIVGDNPAYPIYSKLIDFDAHPVWYPSDGCDDAATYYVAHGTHVAGTIAAKFGSGSVVGVAPGVRVAAYKVFDRYRFTNEDEEVIDDVGAFDGSIFKAIIDAANKGYTVINLSLGSVFDRRYDNAALLAWDRVMKFANRMGMVVVAAAGNAALNSNGTLGFLPADLPTVFSTSATGSNNLVLEGGQFNAAPGSDVLAYYSDYGGATDIAAPGGDCGQVAPPDCAPGTYAEQFIWSAYIFESGPYIGLPGYAAYIGTSMASPHVAAAAAVVRALHPEWTPGEVRSFLRETAEKIGSRQAFGHGMVNADAASK
ncbi:MAG TPA: S8 family serine peptidase, partial [Vicinamibacterales bacterium]|nr:S8 family serine peptidase [Vicinamibacterales bacterium]